MKKIGQVLANKGVEAEYRRKMENLIDAMNKSVLYWLLIDTTSKTPAQVAKQLQKRVKQWKKVFGSHSDKMAMWFVNSVRKHTEYGMKRAFLESGLNVAPKVDKKTQQAVAIENDALIKSIPEKYFDGIEVIAMMSLLYGWNKPQIAESIDKKYKVTIRRAKIIASDQNHKANELFKLAICNDMGIKFGEWKYTYRSKEPRQSHIAANGRLFRLDKGCFIDGEYIYPAQEYNCKCDFVPVIEELGDKPIMYKNL